MTYRALIDAVLDAGGWTTDRKVAAEIGCAESTATQHRRVWQRGHSVKHNNGNTPLPADVVALIWEAREEMELSWREVARAVKETYGLIVKASRCADLYRRGGYVEKRSSPNIDYLSAYAGGYTPVPKYTFPLETAVGTMYGPKITAPSYSRKGHGKYETCCDHCPHRAQCQQPGSVCRCETVQVDEVM